MVRTELYLEEFLRRLGLLVGCFLPVKKTWYVKFLGVLLDENLSLKYHRTKLSKKLTRTCGIIFKIIPINVLICFYNSLFSPFLQYEVLVWGLTFEFYNNPVYLLQKSIIRTISFEHFNSHSFYIFGPKSPKTV